MNKINLIFIILISFLAFVVFNAWIFSPVISSGDSWYYFPQMFDNLYLYPYAWYSTAMGNGLGGQGYVHQNVSMVAFTVLYFAKSVGTSWETASRLLLYLPYVLISLFSSIFLIRKLFPENNFWIFTPIIFVFNSYILMTVGGGQIITAISYAIMPLTVYAFITLSEKVNTDKLDVLIITISCSFLLIVQTILDLRIAFITSVAVFVWLIITLINKFSLKTLFVFVLPYIFLTLINLFWLIPVVLYGIDPIKELGSAYRSTKVVEFLSFAKLENSIALMHPYFPENIFGKVGFMRPEFLFLPILAFASLLFIKKNNKYNKTILYFAIIGLLGIFLGKGANDPFGNFYIFMFDNVPGFQLFRDSFKWYGLTALSFSILIPYSIREIYLFLKNTNRFKRIRSARLEIIFIAITSLLILFILKPAVTGELKGTFKPRVVPQSYVQLNDFLASDEGFYRILWVPQNMQFGHSTNSHISISGRDFFREYNLESLTKKISSPSARRVLEEASVKYIIVPEDTESEIYLTDRVYDDKKYQKIVSDIEEIPWLMHEQSFGKVKVYKTADYKSRFWCDCEADIDYEIVNPTRYKLKVTGAGKNDKLIFSEAYSPKWVLREESGKLQYSKPYNKFFNSFALPENDSKFEVIYEPQKLVDIGVRISALTIIVLLVLFFLIIVKRKK